MYTSFDVRSRMLLLLLLMMMMMMTTTTTTATTMLMLLLLLLLLMMMMIMMMQLLLLIMIIIMQLLLLLLIMMMMVTTTMIAGCDGAHQRVIDDCSFQKVTSDKIEKCARGSMMDRTTCRCDRLDSNFTCNTDSSKTTDSHDVIVLCLLIHKKRDVLTVRDT
jgi:hypothetical protein